MKRVDLIKIITAAGYTLYRKGGHDTYSKKGCSDLYVPHHSEINKYTAKQILKNAGIQ
jgi:predicted RNA binding protein YcfA (HicA-like mRNA interferase family)